MHAMGLPADPAASVDIEALANAALDRGDHAGAATTLLRGYGPQILSYLTAVLRDEDRAGEAFADFSEDLWRGLPSFERRCPLRAWAYKIARHAALKIASDPYRRRGEALASDAYTQLAAEVRSTTAVHLRTESKDWLNELRAELTLEEQTLLVLRSTESSAGARSPRQWTRTRRRCASVTSA
jgi:RNA polymerase sigma-70 factor (ECF subfamily)